MKRQLDNGKWWMTRKEAEVLTDDTEWVVLDKGNEECIGQQQRQQRKRGKSQKIMPMHGAMMLKIQETRNVFDERKGKGGEKGNKQKNLSDHGGARGGDAMKKETVSWQRKEKMTQNKHTENQGQSTTPCNSNHAKLSGGAAPQQHSPQPEPTPLLGRREQITKKCLKCTLCHWKKVKLTLLENTASQSVWFQPAIQSLNLWRSAVKSNSFFYLLHEVGKPAKTPSSSPSQVHHHASPPITVHHTLSPCLPMSTVWGMQNLSPSQPNANLIKAKSLALKLPQSNVKPPPRGLWMWRWLSGLGENRTH